jgi:Siphovirus Gp157
VTLIHPHDPSSACLPLTLARLTGEFLELAATLADTDPADPEALALVEAALDRSTAAIRDKAEATAAVIREFEARAAAAQAEGERILAHARTTRARATWLRAYLLRNLQALGVERLQTATTVLSVRPSPPAVEIVDEDQIPDAFKRLVPSVDKAGLRSALLDGASVPGARLVHGAHLVLR